MNLLQKLDMPPGPGVGIDLVEIARFARLQQNPRFLERVFTPQEQAEIGDGVARTARLAARWAAKEACAKALGCGIGPRLTWLDMEIHRDQEGKPHLHLTPSAAQHHGHPELHLSMTHDGDYAAAIVWIPTHAANDPAIPRTESGMENADEL